MAYPFAEYESIAQDMLEATVFSGIFQRTPFLTLATGQNTSDEAYNKPGGLTLIGGRTAGMPKMMKQALRGSTYYEPAIETNGQGGGKGVGYRESLGTVSNIDILGAMKFPWSHYTQPMKIMFDDIDAAQGDFKVVDLLQTTMKNAMHSLQKLIAPDLFTGNPTQTNKVLNAIIGARVALDSGSTYATYGNVDKTVQTELKPALFSSTVTAFDWSLIDAVNAGDGTNPNGGAATLGPGVDLVIVNQNLFYNTIKPKARADSYQIINVGEELPEFGKIGWMKEAVRYGSTLIIFDPYCPAGTSSALSQMYCLTANSWRMQIHPDYDFNKTKWVDQREITQENAMIARVDFKGRLVCPQPWLNGLYTAVN